MFQALGSFAEYERDMIRARVNAGIARAKAAGKHCGRPPLAPELAERIRRLAQKKTAAIGTEATT